MTPYERAVSLQEAESAHDIDRVLSNYSSTASLVVNGQEFLGRDAIRAFYRTLFERFPSFGVKIIEAHTADDTIVLEVEAVGDSQTSLDSQRAAVLATVLTFDDAGLIKSSRIYFDLQATRLQTETVLNEQLPDIAEYVAVQQRDRVYVWAVGLAMGSVHFEILTVDGHPTPLLSLRCIPWSGNRMLQPFSAMTSFVCPDPLDSVTVSGMRVPIRAVTPTG